MRFTEYVGLRIAHSNLRTPQPADDQVDEIRTIQWQPMPREKPGARIDVWLIERNE